MMQFDELFCFKDISCKPFFTMATLLMPLLNRECAVTRDFSCQIAKSSSDFIYFTNIIIKPQQSTRTDINKGYQK